MLVAADNDVDNSPKGLIFITAGFNLRTNGVNKHCLQGRTRQTINNGQLTMGNYSFANNSQFSTLTSNN
jgi:hypothetical protein